MGKGEREGEEKNEEEIRGRTGLLPGLLYIINGVGEDNP